MLKDKNFVHSKIRNDFKAEYDILNNIRSYPEPLQAIKQKKNNLYDRFYFVMISMVSLTLVPTTCYIIYKRNEKDVEHIWMFLIVQIGMIISII